MKLNNINDIDKYDKIDLEVDTMYDLMKYDKQLMLLLQHLNSLKGKTIIGGRAGHRMVNL